jgi:hypothetical protein
MFYPGEETLGCILNSDDASKDEKLTFENEDVVDLYRKIKC